MNYTGILTNDYANGADVGVALFVSGCDLYCNKGECHGADYYDFKCGIPFTDETIQEIFDIFTSEKHYGRLTITGGNPTSKTNPETLIPFVRSFKEKFPHVKVWLYSGHTYEELEYMDMAYELVKSCDVLVDGRWEPEQHRLDVKYRGSSNQRIIDIQETLKKDEIVVMEKYM